MFSSCCIVYYFLMLKSRVVGRSFTSRLWIMSISYIESALWEYCGWKLRSAFFTRKTTFGTFSCVFSLSSLILSRSTKSSFHFPTYIKLSSPFSATSRVLMRTVRKRHDVFPEPNRNVRSYARLAHSLLSCAREEAVHRAALYFHRSND